MAQWRSRASIVSRADAAQLRGDWVEAARLYEIAITRSPQRADLLIQLGHANKECGRYHLSYQSYLRAANIKPNDDDAYLHLGHILKVSGNIFCASRCYLAAAILKNTSAITEYDNIKLITKAPRFFLRKNAAVETHYTHGHPDGVVQQFNLILGTLEMCEVDPADVARLREAAQLLFLAGFAEAAKGIFEMCFLREGFGSVGRRNSIEIALRTGLWQEKGPFLNSLDNTSVCRGMFPTDSREVVAWLVDEFKKNSIGRAMNPDSGSCAMDRAFAEFTGSSEPRAVAAHEPFSPSRTETIRHLVSRLYDALAAADAAGDWAQLRVVIRDLKGSVADAVPLISFDTDEIRDSVEAHASRVLFNNLYDFVSDNASMLFGSLASPHVLATASRFDCPLLAPYLLRTSSLHESSSELVDDVAQEIKYGAHNYDDYARRHAVEQVVALVGGRVEVRALLRLFAAVVDGNLPNATAALLRVLNYPKHTTNPQVMVLLSRTLRDLGYPGIALDILQKIRGHGSPRPGSVEFDGLVDQGILEKIRGNFRVAAQIFLECSSIDRGNRSLKEELLTLLPETEDIDKVIEKVNADPELRELAQQRRLFRLHFDGWKFHGAPIRDAEVGIENQVPELAPELVRAPRTTVPGERGEGMDILQLGWERRQSQWGNLPVLRGIEAIRVRVISLAPLVAMRVRFDGRTVCVERARKQTRGFERTNEYMFNAWVDASALRFGLHELQLYFEEYSGGYRVREELVFVDQPLVRNERTHASGSVVALDDSTAGLPLDERINSLPSIIYSTRRPFFETPIRRVLVVRADQLGDFVISIPAINKLRDLFPEARFFGLVSRAALEVAQTLEFFDELFEINMIYEPIEGRRYLSLHDQIELRSRLGNHSFDLAIDLSTGSDTRPVLRLSGAPITVGFKPHEFPWLTFGIDTVTRDALNGRERVPHGTVMMMLVDALGTLLSEPNTLNPPRPANARLLERFGVGEGERYLLLHSGARLHMKQWPLTHYRELARLAVGSTDLRVVMLVDDPSRLPEIDGAGLPGDRFRAVTGPLPFAELDALVSHCTVMVGNDSGPKHLAAFRGAKVVSVHMGQVNWQEWGQEGDGAIVTRHVPCYGCGIVESHECGKDLACLVHIRPEEVLAAVKQVLEASIDRDALAVTRVSTGPHADAMSATSEPRSQRIS
jgi:ADP-heptose:LPS heptosyltransferase